MPSRINDVHDRTSIVTGTIVNKTSINLAPFRIIRIRYYTDFYGSGTVHWEDSSYPKSTILRTDKSQIKSQDFRGWPNPLDIDVSSINEQAFVKIRGGSSGDYNGGMAGGNMHITQIEFIV